MSPCLFDCYSDWAVALLKQGWQVHVLLCSVTGCENQEHVAAGLLRDRGVACTCLGEATVPASVALSGPCQPIAHQVGERVRYVLTQLHSSQRFAAIEFADWGALGFRSVQAKKFGLAFADVPLLVTVHAPSEWRRQQQQCWPTADDMALEYSEKYAFEQADFQLLSRSAFAEVIQSLGWKSSADRLRVLNESMRADTASLYEGLLAASPDSLQPDAHSPLVTVSIAHYNLGSYLEAALQSLAEQTYPCLEIIVIDDGSTDPHSRQVLHELSMRFPNVRFLSHSNCGIGATRNRGLQLARGKYFLPMDADNLAHPDMLHHLVAALERNPDVAAVSCYFLAFHEDTQLTSGNFDYAYRPTGGPHMLASLRNVYGDGNALFRTNVLRGIGGFATDRDTSWEDWEVFIKLVQAGYVVDVVPEYLFYYRHRESGFSRTTNGYRNHQRILRRFVEWDNLTPSDRHLLWNTLAGFHRRLEHLENENQALHRRLQARRHRLADWLHRGLSKVRSLLAGF